MAEVFGLAWLLWAKFSYQLSSAQFCATQFFGLISNPSGRAGSSQPDPVIGSDQ